MSPSWKYLLSRYLQVHFYILLLVLCLLYLKYFPNYCSFMVSLKSDSKNSAFVLHVQILESVSQFQKKCFWNFDVGCFNFIDQFEED